MTKCGEHKVKWVESNMFASCAGLINENKKRLKIKSLEMSNNNTSLVHRGLLCFSNNQVVISTIQSFGKTTKRIGNQMDFKLQGMNTNK